MIVSQIIYQIFNESTSISGFCCSYSRYLKGEYDDYSDIQ